MFINVCFCAFQRPMFVFFLLIYSRSERTRGKVTSACEANGIVWYGRE